LEKDVEKTSEVFNVNRQVYLPAPSPELFSSLAINGTSFQVVVGG
jgi:hypothetical protein